MKLVLHLGTAKTGTTALQRWLDANDEALRAQGVWYCASLGRANNRDATSYAADWRPLVPALLRRGIGSPEALEAFRSETEPAFAAEARAARRAGARLFVISNEHLAAGLRTPGEVDRLATLTAARFEASEAVCYLRPQVDLAVSRLSVFARAGVIEPANLDPSPSDADYDYLGLYERWTDAWPGPLSLLPYVRLGDVVSTFADRYGIDAGALSRPGRVNGAIDVRLAQLSYNLRLPRITGGEIDRNRDFYAGELPCEEPVTVSRRDALAMHERFAAGNAALCARTSGVTEEDLTPDPARYPVQGNAHRVFEPVEGAAFVREIVVRKNVELRLRTAEARYATALLRLQEGNVGAARRALRQCRTQLLSAAQAKLPAYESEIAGLGREAEDAAAKLGAGCEPR